MKFTFGVCTTEGNEQRILNIISSIHRNKIPLNDYEIIVVGNVTLPAMPAINLKIINFNESIKRGWITKKKNIISHEAKHENVVYIHDYIILESGWYESMCKFGEEWEVLMTRIINHDGSRYRDWALCGSWQHNPFIESRSERGLLPYTEKRLSRFMYISGAYWLAKKRFMTDNPLNENLAWGQGEDVEWSMRINKNINFHLNEKAIVKINKAGKSPVVTLCRQEYLNDVYDFLVDKNNELPFQMENVERTKYFKGGGSI